METEKKKTEIKLTPQIIPVIAAVLWLLGTWVGYFLNDLIFSESATITLVTVIWAIVWVVALVFWASISLDEM